MADGKFKPDASATSIMTTELNALGGSGSAISSSTVDHGNATTGLRLFGGYELAAGVQTAITAGDPFAVLYVLPNYGTAQLSGDASNEPSKNYLLGVFTDVLGTTATQYMGLPRRVIEPYVSDYVIVSKTGQTWSATGNTLKVAQYMVQSA